ncbi:uncharacterized protein LOC128883113 [Hylaeus volcanicus]|uniref:uncharacterized protein LOC128883113 n=1 Tax=Hylaeus volcanicus TaxID=313075 RepID=UPI0023B80605|nr:uncharacterized protein LOC128883113 [Hylaeus volcanicus]
MTFQYLCFIEPYLGVLKDSCLLSQSRNENDAVSLGMVTGCQSFSKLVEMALCFQCRHTLLGKHEEGSSNVLSFAKTALQFEFPLHMWTFPSVHDVRFPSSTTSTVLVISSDPSKDIGRTQVYLLHNCIDEPSVNCSRSQEPNMLAQVEEITGGFDTDINTIGCGSLYFERESELRDDNNSKECLWIQITPTEIRCLACQSPYSLLQNPVNLLHLNAEECDMTSPYLDIPLGIKGCIVKEFVLVMTESFHIKIWKANSTAYKDLCNNLLTTTCLLNPYTNGTKHLEFMLSQPLECFYLTCLDQLEQNTVLKHIPSVTLIYLVFVCKAKPNTICIVSCDTMEIVFRTEITPFQKHLLNTNKKNEDFLVPFMPMTSHATARIVKSRDQFY